MTTYAYARVSAADQNTARQLAAFAKFGVDPKNVFSDKISGKDFDRLGYRKLLRKLKQGDLIVIKSIDRLGRNYGAIIEEWTRITKKYRADILVLDMPILDTRTKTDTLVGTFICDLVLQALSFAAENERTNIKQRQAEGIAIAKSRGVKFGRPQRDYSSEFVEVANAYLHKSIPLSNALALLRISKATYYYHVKKMTAIGLLSPIAAGRSDR